MAQDPPSFLTKLLVGSRLSGPALPAAAALLRAPALARGISRLVIEQLGVPALQKLGEAARRDIPLDARPLMARPPRGGTDAAKDQSPAALSSGPATAAALTAAFLEGTLDPEEALRRFLRGVEKTGDCSPVAAVAPGAAEAAAAAAARYRAGAPLSPLDGVPVTIKEEAAIAGLPLRLGARFTQAAPAPRDATVVARLRAAGAVIAAQSKMTEYGLSPLGTSAQQKLPPNPHARGYSAGGSSTGAAAAVALGLGPLAIGGDGGGSIRIPSSLCGVFGLKPTFGRLPRTGDPFGGTLDHLGPIGASVADLAAALAITCGPDEEDPASAWAPPDTAAARASYSQALSRSVRTLRIGVCDELFAACDADIAHEGARALDRLCEEGAVRVRVKLPLSAHAGAIGYLTFGSELLCSLRPFLDDPQMGPDLRMALLLLGQLPFDAYLDAQRLRAGLRAELLGAFGDIDLLALPTTAIPGPPLSEVERGGMIDLDAIDRVVRFTFLGNLTGLPALSAPVGERGMGPAGVLPFGLQLVGDAWDEATLLAAAAVLEGTGAAKVRRPEGGIDLLSAGT